MGDLLWNGFIGNENFRTQNWSTRIFCNRLSEVVPLKNFVKLRYVYLFHFKSYDGLTYWPSESTYVPEFSSFHYIISLHLKTCLLSVPILTRKRHEYFAFSILCISYLFTYSKTKIFYQCNSIINNLISNLSTHEIASIQYPSVQSQLFIFKFWT